MIGYRGHIVYVTSMTYPTIAPASAVERPAKRTDLDSDRLGVLSEGRCVPLSLHERNEVRRMNGLNTRILNARRSA